MEALLIIKTLFELIGKEQLKIAYISNEFGNEIYKTLGSQQCIAWSTKVPKNMSTCCLLHENIANLQ